MHRTLSANQKIQYLPILIKRQGGFNCLYCRLPLTTDNMIYEHLNGKRTDNRLENLALAHQSCNIKKIDNFDYQIIANEQLKRNEDQMFLREKNQLEEKSPLDASTEININVTNSDIAEQFLMEKINTDDSVLFSEALDSLVFLCKKKTGHGSHQAIRNYIKALVSEVGPFMITKNEEKKKIIVKRVGN
jgi:hypothetical protein